MNENAYLMNITISVKYNLHHHSEFTWKNLMKGQINGQL